MAHNVELTLTNEFTRSFTGRKRRIPVRKVIPIFCAGNIDLGSNSYNCLCHLLVVSSIDALIPIFTTVDATGKVHGQNYGLGFIIVIAAICLTGYFSSFFIKLKFFNLFDSWLAKAPGIRFIYTTVKDFFEAFAGEKKKFNKPVLANINDNDVWRMGFITQTELKDFGFIDYVAVYIPASYSIAGNVYLLPRNRVKPVTNINATDAMKFAISGGVTDVDEERKMAVDSGVDG